MTNRVHVLRDSLLRTPCNASQTLTSHVEEGSTNGDESQFITFTSTLDVTKKIFYVNKRLVTVSVKVADQESLHHV